ncbi:hypothetical protein OIU74_015077 [Salix koriyanagi]|uniref:Uncharacterized protein n=1 Tax=Salix koriyanagi TaxID=2511006 RepID=A0A9Q0PXB0_9ROSI|nr:hypothetical protein OIU74_015077 [Salix koriyanagi]
MEGREEVLLQKMANGVVAMVKRIREMNTLSITEFNAEIRRKLGRLLNIEFLQAIEDSVGLFFSRLLKELQKVWAIVCTEFDSSNLPHGNLKSSTVPTFIANYM